MLLWMFRAKANTNKVEVAKSLLLNQVSVVSKKTKHKRVAALHQLRPNREAEEGGR
jgi:hypothetical protein